MQRGVLNQNICIHYIHYHFGRVIFSNNDDGICHLLWALILSQALYTCWMLFIFIHTTPSVTSTIFSPVYRLGKSQRSYKPKWSQNQILDVLSLSLSQDWTDTQRSAQSPRTAGYLFPQAHSYTTITQTETEDISSSPGGSAPGVPPHPEGHLGLPRHPLLVSPSAPLLCKGLRTWKSTYLAMWREVVAQAHSHGRKQSQNKNMGRGQGTGVAGGNCPWGEVRACPRYPWPPQHTRCLVGWDSISRAWGPKRAEAVAGVQVLHIKQRWFLPLPGIPVSNKKQNADKWKRDVFAGTVSTGREDRPTRGSHRKFQAHFIILSLAIINSSQIQGCVFTLLCLNPASPSYCLSDCPTDQGASLELYNLLGLLHSPDSILYETALLPAVKCWPAACIWLFLSVL